MSMGAVNGEYVKEKSHKTGAALQSAPNLVAGWMHIYLEVVDFSVGMAHRVTNGFEGQTASAEGEQGIWEVVYCIAEFLALRGRAVQAICILITILENRNYFSSF